MKKLLVSLLCVMMMVTFMPVMAWANDETEGDTSWYKDNTNVFEISTAEQLRGLAKLVDEGKGFEGKTIKLGDNIDLEGKEWEPIGDEEKEGDKYLHTFKGTFDGNGNTIRNLKINQSTDEYLGLFAVTESPAIIKNLTIQNADVTGQASVGALAGSAYTGTVEDCHITGEIHIKGNYKVGGLAGGGYAQLSGCTVEASEGSTVTGEYKAKDLEGDNVGGLIGFRGEGDIKTINCSVSGMEVTGTRKVGGVLGYLNYGNTISNCSAHEITVKSNATSEYISKNKSSAAIGGLVGVVHNENKKAPAGINNCYVENITLDRAHEGVEMGYGYGLDRLYEGLTSANTVIEHVYVTGANSGATDTAALGNDSDNNKMPSLGAALNLNGTITYYGNLEDALQAALEAQTEAEITLYEDAELNDAKYIIKKPLTIKNAEGNQYTVTATVAAGATTIGFNLLDNGNLTLDNVGLTITGTSAGDNKWNGTAVDVGKSELKLENNANLTIQNLKRGLVMSGGDQSNVVITDSELNASNIDGNFSNGGKFAVNNSKVSISNCGSYGMSANEITLDNAILNFDKINLSAIRIGVNDGKLSVFNNSTITVKNSGDGLPWTNSPYGIANGVIDIGHSNNQADKSNASLNVDSGSKITLDSTNKAEANSVYLTIEANLNNQGEITKVDVEKPAPTEENYKQVVFISDGQVLSIEKVLRENGSFEIELPNAPSKSGYLFQGWSDGSKTFTAGERVEITDNTTFTAKWSKINTSPTPTTQKPTIEADAHATVTLSSYGTIATIKVADGYELVDVVLNGTSLGKVTTVTGLKTGDKLVVTTISKKELEEQEYNEYLKNGVQNTTIKATSRAKKGKMMIDWKKSPGFKVDGYEFFRTTKKDKYDEKPFFKTNNTKAKGTYTNTKNLKKGTRYYYKMRGFRTIDGELVYTQWSTIATRTAK